ncbi:GNAT family N-acetyltransferase [Flavobacterium capsici]|uniref:GNAT family protein n=1 Tax=Flavobacterium capsici TaxID=3075618 RepID=A0AA96ET63_9FLAO|nr:MULTISPECIES: GNAT family protein [unclassified Flavobacterium]WNM17988.1 GNAT family protein [Flavobacterium sp. PMR2A8]WNM22040.1 GNAT family protein [Flavobacterium sp. PMTSA4]
MNKQAILTTERLLLKGITPALIHELYNSKSKEEIMNYFEFDEAGYENFKNKHEKGMETDQLSLFFFLLVDKSTNKTIGDCGFHTWNRKHRRAEVFYMMRNEEYKQKGLMTEAVAAVLEYGFTVLELHRVEALVADWNTPSIKLLQRYGFTKEGTMREDYFFDGKNVSSECYSLLKWEWEGIKINKS